DLPPDELLQRLAEGKVYVPDQAARAIEKFFRKGNLTALRELAMRRAAERVDHQMQAYMQTRSIPGPWPAAERLVVCVGTGPLSERLVRSARRLADELNADWLAVYVETPDSVRLPQEKRDLVARVMQQAEQLGAKTVTLTGQSIAKTITAYARQHNITRILVGKTLRSGLDKLLHGNVADQLIAVSGEIDIIVVSSKPGPAGLTETVASQVHSPWQRYIWGISLVILATGINTLVRHWISPTNLVMVYLLAVVLAAGYLGRGPSILVSILGVLAFDYFFVPPRLTFDVSETEYLLTFGGLLGVGLVISQLTARVRDQAEAAENREANTATLYSLSRDLAVAGGLETVLRAITTHVSQTFGREVVIFIPDPEAEDILKPYSEIPGIAKDEKEFAVAVWSYQHGQSAGRGTATLSASQARYLPLKTAQGIVGVLGVKPKYPESQLPPEQRRLLEAFANQAALAIERVQLAEQARKSQLHQATEKLQTALLNSISHDLRTPLVSITGALSSLQDDAIAEDQETRHNLLDTAREEADRLNRLVGNLLNMTRIEAGAMRISFELSDVQDVIGTALEQVNNRLDDRQVFVNIPVDLPLIPMDFVLINQVLVNLLDNAIKYSPAQSPIEVRAKSVGVFVEIEVMDHGIGIPPEDLKRIFDKFYRVQRPDNVIGTGLGLSICKGIVEAHGGFIGAENRPGGGTTITIALPVKRIEPKNHLVQEGEA
ncbi:MAG TPA: sensor histidine kinase KdpD, partial [Anaerolineales bacterium]